MKYSKALWAYRKERGYTLKRMSELLGVGESTAQKWEVGAHSPSPMHRRGILKLLGMDKDDIEWGDDEFKSVKQEHIAYIRAHEGKQHARDTAKALGMSTIYVNRIRSSLGLTEAMGSWNICINCINAVPTADGTRGCEWSRHFKPVEGWEAECILRYRSDIGAMEETYHITDCPEFEED